MFNLIIILYNIYINKNIIIFNNHKSKVIIYHLHIINSISFLFILRINTSYFFLFIETLYHLYYTKIITALTICNSTHLIICSLFKNQTVNSFFEFLLKLISVSFSHSYNLYYRVTRITLFAIIRHNT